MIDSTSGRTIRAGIPGARLLLILLAFLVASGPSWLAAVPAAAAPLRGESTDESSPQSLAERWTVPDGLPDLPDISAEAVFVGDIDTGQVLFASDADAQRAPASTAKVAIVVTLVDILTDLNEVVTVQDSDTVDITLFSNAQLGVGDEVTVEGLLYGLMLPSGNDAARALARVAGETLDPDSDDPDPPRSWTRSMPGPRKSERRTPSSSTRPARTPTGSIPAPVTWRSSRRRCSTTRRWRRSSTPSPTGWW